MAKITEVTLEAEDRLAARLMEQISAIYKSVETKSKTTKSANTGASIDLDSLKLVKGKKGKLGKGSHGVVRLAHYQPDDGGEARMVAVRYRAGKKLVLLAAIDWLRERWEVEQD